MSMLKFNVRSFRLSHIAILVSTLLSQPPAVAQPAKPTPADDKATNDANGFFVHQLESPYQSGKGPEGTTPLQLNGHDEDSTVNALAFQRGGPLLASGGGDGKVALWQPERGKRMLAESKLDAGITQVAWSGDDARIAVGTDGGEIAVYAI